MQLCPESETKERHTGKMVYHYKKTAEGSYDQFCNLCSHLEKVDASNERKDREEKEKKAKKAADKVTLKQDPGKERTKPRHDKSEKEKK